LPSWTSGASCHSGFKFQIIMCDVPGVAVFCKVCWVIAGITKNFMFHSTWSSILKYLYQFLYSVLSYYIPIWYCYICQ
jgi:hypothetical protein